MKADKVSRSTRFMLGAVALLVIAGLTGAPKAIAHLFLTEESLDDAIRGIAEWHAQIVATSVDCSDQEALFRVGEASWALADLLNEEVRVHGLGQQALMTEAIERARAYDVSIAWSDDHQRFFYDGAAFRRYVAAAPDGAFAADSRYRIIELDFYLGPADSVAALQTRVMEKRRFLDKYPGYAAGARIGIFLGIDYRDLYRLCRQSGAEVCGEDYAALALSQFERVAASNADSDSGEVARRLLQRTRDEVDGTR